LRAGFAASAAGASVAAGAPPLLSPPLSAAAGAAGGAAVSLVAAAALGARGRGGAFGFSPAVLVALFAGGFAVPAAASPDAGTGVGTPSGSAWAGLRTGRFDAVGRSGFLDSSS
jgi:hypothetical protein